MNRRAFVPIAILVVTVFLGCGHAGYPGASTRESSPSPTQKTSANLTAQPAVGLTGVTPQMYTPEVQKVIEELKQLGCNAGLRGGVLRIGLYSRRDSNTATDAKIEKIAELAKGLDKLSLNLIGGSFTGAGLERLKGLTNLQSLGLGGSPPVTDADLAHLAEFSNLRSLALVGSLFADGGLPHVAGLTDLERLTLKSEGNLSDKHLTHLKKLTKLEELEIHHSAVTDAGLQHLKELTRLRRLFFTDSRVTYAGLATLRRAKNMEGAYATPALLRSQDLEKMRQIWPKFRGEDLMGEGSFLVWNAATGEEVMIGPSWPTFSPDGKKIAMILDGTLHFVDARTGAPIGRLDQRFPPEFGSLPIAFSGDGARIAVGGPDKTARVWHVATGKQLLALPPQERRLRAVALSPEGQLLAGAEEAGAVHLWKVATGERVRDFQASYYPHSLAFSPDGKKLGGVFSDAVVIWNVADGEKILELENSGASFWFSADGKTLIRHNRVSVFVHDVETGRQLRKHDGAWPKKWNLVVSPDGEFLARPAGWGVRVWDVARGQLLHHLGNQYLPGNFRVHFVNFTPDGKGLAASWVQWDVIDE